MHVHLYYKRGDNILSVFSQHMNTHNVHELITFQKFFYALQCKA